tara:strand:+ start:269 stop:451 length:183 start_codon:yes stop_codon:yes gene_type:complete
MEIIEISQNKDVKMNLYWKTVFSIFCIKVFIPYNKAPIADGKGEYFTKLNENRIVHNHTQ